MSPHESVSSPALKQICNVIGTAIRTTWRDRTNYLDKAVGLTHNCWCLSSPAHSQIIELIFLSNR